MMNKFHKVKNLTPAILVITLCSLGLAVILQGVLSVGVFWRGFLAAFILLFLSGMVLYLLWFAAGGRKTLAWMMVVAFILRLAYGLFLSWGLPRFGYDEPGQQAGFVFTDPFIREQSAWELANSGESLLRAFSDDYPSDQYGGLLGVSALIYRTLSPDAHRPGLIIILAATAMALSIPFLVSAIQTLFGKKIALRAGWIFVFYPEGILLGAAQMREPFLILFFSMLFWAGAKVLSRSQIKRAWFVLFVSTIGSLLLSYRVALPILGVIFLWVWVVESEQIEQRKLKILIWIALALTLLGGLWLGRDWLQSVTRWDMLLTVINSGQIQFQLEGFPKWLYFPFVLLYGVFQPIFPAAIADPAPWIWRSLGILRGAGWYALAPLLVNALIGVWWIKPSKKKRWLAIIILLVWVWIFIASARAGGDQWDNPRYRTIFLPWFALVASWIVDCAIKTKDRWLGRVIVVEGIFLAFITEWYLSRYYAFFPRPSFWMMLALIFGFSLLVIVGGLIWDRRHPKSG